MPRKNAVVNWNHNLEGIICKTCKELDKEIIEIAVNPDLEHLQKQGFVNYRVYQTETYFKRIVRVKSHLETQIQRRVWVQHLSVS